MTTTEKRLAYGTYHVSAEELSSARAAWGARLIWPADIVPDRTDTFGSTADKAIMFEALNARAPQPSEYRRLLADQDIDSRSDEAAILYEDDDIKVVASAQASAGYLYVTALLKPLA